ncbi:MAG TPA: hypothetical protein VNV42_04350 [Solirubrobacteraceae bacterium]|jgi:hypothetical protein|nr:hypothetical protein [Solirubrobacteraceae bacterium]
MVASFHIADVGIGALARLRPGAVSPNPAGWRYAELAIAAPLGGRLLPRPQPGRAVLVAAWDDDDALDRFLAQHPLAARLAGGWHVRLQPTHVFGSWARLPGLPEREQPMDDEEPAAVLTIGRLRLAQALRFLRASAAAEELAVGDPALLASTGLARPPRLLGTFSLWRTTAAMRAYASGRADPRHNAAAREHRDRPFHSESAFVRFRPYAARGSWDGRDPLAGVAALAGAA